MQAKKKQPKKRQLKQRQKTVTGFYRVFYAMNLMLEAASFHSEHELTRHETLLLSIFRNGIMSRERVDEEFRKLLSVNPKDEPAAQELEDAFTGLVRKGLIKPVKRSVEITVKGRRELRRLSAVVDTVYDQFIDRLHGRERKDIEELMRKMGEVHKK